jgi:hypothetical protein
VTAVIAPCSEEIHEARRRLEALKHAVGRLRHPPTTISRIAECDPSLSDARRRLDVLASELEHLQDGADRGG